jgi:hypothetical protein
VLSVAGADPLPTIWADDPPSHFHLPTLPPHMGLAATPALIMGAVAEMDDVQHQTAVQSPWIIGDVNRDNE